MTREESGAGVPAREKEHSVCVVVADDHGARVASHALRAAGWGGVHFESNPAAAVRVAQGGRATVLNVIRSQPDEVDAALTALGPNGFDWRSPPPELSQEEWEVLYARSDVAATKLTPRAAANRMASARAAFGVADDAALLAAFEELRLPAP